MTNELSQFLNAELKARTVSLNKKPLRRPANFVLVWLQQTLRGDDHPTIDAGVSIANNLQLPVLVYHGLREDYPHASDRLHRFIIGASRNMARRLRERDIAVAQHIVRPGHIERGLVYRLAKQAALVVTDLHATFVGRTQAESFAAKTDATCLAVDATRLVPHSALPGGLSATKAFRAAHKPLREEWLAARAEIEPQETIYSGSLPFTPDDLADMEDAQLDELVAACRIDHSLLPSAEFEATQPALDKKLNALIQNVVERYKWTRNNPANEYSSSRLSPYLHFGMTSPFEILRNLHDANIATGAQWKFLDELLTWREWCHWRMTERPDLCDYESLPSAARESLDRHRRDEREVLLSYDDLIHGRSPDETWNAAQKQWLLTGWLHNNLRMYWAKQVLRWTKTPEDAWAICCAINDHLSLDGRDPATYVSIRWAFGEGRKGYREIPVYGWVAPKSDVALRKRPGASEWLREMANKDVPDIDTTSFENTKTLYLEGAEP